MKFIKNKIMTLIAILIAVFLVMIPNRSEAYNNYPFVCTDELTCYFPEVGQHRIAGVWHSMHKNGSAWLNSRPIRGSGYGGENPSELAYGVKFWTDTGLETVDSVGGLCFGHNRTGEGEGQGSIIKVVIDTYDESTGKINTDVSEQLLGYAAYKSSSNQETGREPFYKNQIRKWIWDNYTNPKYGGFIQSTDANARENYDTEEAKRYANAATNEALLTFSTEEEGARQSIEYKNGNTFIGPYHLKTEFGTLEKAKINTREGSSYDTSLCSIDGNTVIPLENITSYNGNEFYIIVERKSSRICSRDSINQKDGNYKFQSSNF